MPTDDPRDAAAPPPPAQPASFGGAPLPYMRWAKRHLGPDAMSLGFSGLAPLTGAERAELGLAAPPEFGRAEALLKEALAERYGMSPENVHPAAGTSHANFVSFLALGARGHIVVERPAYEALPTLATTVGSSVAHALRDPERGWRFDPDRLAHALHADTKLIAVSDLHNPSGTRLHPDDLELLLEAAESRDARLLIDEVYADFDPRTRPTAALRSPRIVVTNSLTKSHGLPDLRAGWVLGAPGIIADIAAWDDLVHPVLPPAPMLEAAAYIPHGPARLEATRARAAAHTDIVDAWVEATDGVRWTKPDGGITGLLRFDGLDGNDVAQRLWGQHGVRAVPGSFFQWRAGLRISYLIPEENLRKALDAIAQVIGDLS